MLQLRRVVLVDVAARRGVRTARTWVARPPGASKAAAPADTAADDAPVRALRRSAGGGLPRKAYEIHRQERPRWRWTEIRGEKIYYRHWKYENRVPTEAWLEGGLPKVPKKLGLTAQEAERARHTARTKGLTAEQLRSIVLKAETSEEVEEKERRKGRRHAAPLAPLAPPQCM
ncbi:unnamed protein product [Durusdinium trenchii]|uniref:39S ribosomal protein L52, mitochondrial n=1 Tax=Durusdinium trenchii TaxID=1381693 RepID=A0ABP0S7Q2_9DINO